LQQDAGGHRRLLRSALWPSGDDFFILNESMLPGNSEHGVATCGAPSHFSFPFKERIGEFSFS